MPLDAKDNLDTVLAATIGPTIGPRIGEAIDALVKERVAQAFLAYDTARVTNVTGRPPRAEDLNLSTVQAHLDKAWGDAS